MDEINQYLTFRVGEEIFSLNVRRVQEVLDFTRVTRVPRMPLFVRGVLNLRGAVVPVIDLGEKLGLGRLEESEDTSIVVAEVLVENDLIVMGLLCDGVDQVITLQPHEIEPPPSMGSPVDESYIHGMGKLGEDFVILLNHGRIIENQDLEAIGYSQES